MSNDVHYPAVAGHPVANVGRRAEGQLKRIGDSTVCRSEVVRSDSRVGIEKLRALQRLTSSAMTGHTLLVRLREALAAGDPLLLDELGFFTAVERVAAMELIADTVDELRWR